MSANSKIEWCDHTFNPWIGCTKVSPGCAHCYAEARDQRFAGGVHWGKGAPRKLTTDANWRLPVKWNRDAAGDVENFQIGVLAGAAMPVPRRPRVFCASLADWLDDEVPAEWLYDLLALIHKTPNLDWLLLTKRPENWESRLRAAAAQCTIDPLDIVDRIHSWLAARHEWSRIPANVWIGTTVEDQARAEERIPALLTIPARVRFLSCEPLLGPVDIPKVLESCIGWKPDGSRKVEIAVPNGVPMLNWVICGGESGHGARPMHPAWARGLRDQCAAAGVPFFFKQWGESAPATALEAATAKRQLCGRFGLARRFSGVTGGILFALCGKHAAGRLLDGIEHNAFPA